jgi:hypothetical protein
MRLSAIRNLFLTCVGVLLLSGCVSTTYESYNSVKGAKVDIAYIATSADFSRYHRLMADEMGIYYPTHATPDDDDLAAVRKAFRSAFLSELSDYDIVDNAQPGVLRVTASLVDLRNTAADRLPQLSREINEILEPGKLTFIIQLSDADTGYSLLRAADTGRSPDMDSLDGDASDTAEVEAAAQYWAKLLRNFLDQNMGSK